MDSQSLPELPALPTTLSEARMLLRFRRSADEDAREFVREHAEMLGHEPSEADLLPQEQVWRHVEELLLLEATSTKGFPSPRAENLRMARADLARAVVERDRILAEQSWRANRPPEKQTKTKKGKPHARK